jgi:hypothetical protein
MRWTGVELLLLALGVVPLCAVGCSEFEGCEDDPTCGGSTSGGAAGGGEDGASGTSGSGGAAGSGGSEGGGTTGGGTDGQGGGGGSVAGGSGFAGSEASGGSGGSDGAAGDGGERGAMGGAGGSGETCEEPTATPSEDSCVIDEEYGVFVSPDGDDESGEGTRAQPYATIGKAIDAAVAGGLRVYACADGGAYEESVTIGVGTSGLEMYGGFSCDDWSYSSEAKSLVSTTEQLALRVEGVEALRVEDFGFQAADAVEAGGSSVGGFVLNSTGVVLRSVRFVAGKGMAGVDGVTPQTDFPWRSPDSTSPLDGNDANGAEGGPAKEYPCLGQELTVGGAGGNSPGRDGYPGLPDWGGGKGNIAGMCNSDVQRGADAPPQLASAGATSLGKLSASGWAPASGDSGAVGHPGQGGGGGSGGNTGGGGGGGAGGCGGGGGSGGQGGGASIALAILESSVVIEDSELFASHAGDSGNGASGEDGQLDFGIGGTGENGGCTGGSGGNGGPGGAGGGGAGGISVGVLWSGEIGPSIRGNDYRLGRPGTRGVGGDPGVNDGIYGVAEEVLDVAEEVLDGR